MDYQFKHIENKWQRFWEAHKTYKIENDTSKPKCYVLDMFPYPSGAGLHVGHPLGYIASDIYARYKRLKGMHVLHPMGYDSFGLPAEQYAIQTGQHPRNTTNKNISRYREQLSKLGFSYDWSREVCTHDPDYYRWTQWIFMQLFDSWYNLQTNRAEPIQTLIQTFEENGNAFIKAASKDDVRFFSAEDWKKMSKENQQHILLSYRLAYLSESTVNWCSALGTVLANDEVKDGFSERGGHPVEKKKMLQWSLRITAYAERLLKGLEEIDWPEPVKEMQRNWIGKSQGAIIKFNLASDKEKFIEVFTTRPDTIFGVSFIVLAPEHAYALSLTTENFQQAMGNYIYQTKRKSEVDRMSDKQVVSGVFTGSYAIHPLSKERIPIWVADYVLSSYGTAAVMAVPSGDQRDYLFAKNYDLPIIPILDAQKDLDKQADPTYAGRYINSGFINGMVYEEARHSVLKHLEKSGLGKEKVAYRLHDAVFGRQRYWGEPVPIYFKLGFPYLIQEADLPLLLPEVDKYLPTSSGAPPLARAKDWKYQRVYEFELSTMPGWAGSSWYWYRYMDPHNKNEFASKESIAYWKAVDLYIGGAEHATGHLLYSRFWNKFLKDRGYVIEEEPFKKLINQGMIQGRSNLVYRIIDAAGEPTNTFVSAGIKNQYQTSALHIDVSIVEKDILDIQKFKKLRADFQNAKFIFEDGTTSSEHVPGKRYLCGVEIEKMSKSKFNVVNPDDIIEQYGADTFRIYEMFLGPLEQSKPWNTNGIEGVFKFLRKFWKLFHDEKNNFHVLDEEPSLEELKALHKIIHKVEEDMERFSFNTSVSSFMICVNKLTALQCNKRKILQDLVIVLSPYAPHITEELWSLLGNAPGTLSYAKYPTFFPEFLQEDEFSYPISFNGKTKTSLTLRLDLSADQVEEIVLKSPEVKRFLGDAHPRKIIFVKGKIINIVI